MTHHCDLEAGYGGRGGPTAGLCIVLCDSVLFARIRTHSLHFLIRREGRSCALARTAIAAALHLLRIKYTLQEVPSKAPKRRTLSLRGIGRQLGGRTASAFQRHQSRLWIKEEEMEVCTPKQEIGTFRSVRLTSTCRHFSFPTSFRLTGGVSPQEKRI